MTVTTMPMVHSTGMEKIKPRMRQMTPIVITVLSLFVGVVRASRADLRWPYGSR